MAAKTSDWRPGPTVCRCCLSEGCYKDISTEYFWMGKREVYSEMLSETFDLSISYSKSGGPNSQSRLICEPCIARLRDAADFKRQVQECEKTFMSCLDPVAALSDLQAVLEMDKEVKVEMVMKEEKRHSDDDFDDVPDFGDDDDYDDLDDQPLTKLATKIPKKETVDVLDLLDNAKITAKRKSSSKLKTHPSKKSKSKQIATSSKEKPEPKKKKGRKSAVVEIKQETEIIAENDALLSVAKTKDIERRAEDNARRAAFRKNIKIIMTSCTAYPFKYRKGTYLCFFCKSTFLDPEKLREHTQITHTDLMFKLKKYEPLKMDIATTTCRLCGVQINDYSTLKAHLCDHGKVLDDTYGESVLPYKLSKDEHCCQICGKRYEMFLSLHKHMNDHYEHFICETCGKAFVTMQRMLNHSRTHERGDFPCKRCGEILTSYASLYAHIAKVHRFNKRYKCPICDEKFASYKYRMKHLNTVHGEKTALFPCPSCPKVFELCSRRTAHIRSHHLQERNHSCSVCGMKFFSNYELQEHGIKHAGARIYQCDVCKKSYARLKTLREHMRIHNNDRRFVCPVCGQSFIQKCSLKQHVRVHHPIQVKADVF
ncbi:zinc finger protein 287-like isoform X5 [Maniola jurtina]|uniref:zinc finger protein 287-like isoform X5 n=1 Tax=Maniola jurtina TaxID=191418 RepID=UPI001E687A25|nr:zinc finger protein 287-like isoform X5 [Maniola jurtina]